MDDDAHDPSLYERLRLLERLVRRQSVQLEADRQKIAELTRARAQDIIWEVSGGVVPPPRVPQPPARHRRDRHGMYLIKGAGATAIVACLWRLLWSTWARRIMTASAALAVAGGTVLTPPVQATLNPAPTHRVDRGTVDYRRMPAGPPPPPRRKAGGQAATGGVLHRHAPTPAPSAAGGGSTPQAVPSVTPAPLPTPVSTPTLPEPTPSVCLPLDPDCDQCDGDCQGKVISGSVWLISKHRLRLAA